MSNDTSGTDELSASLGQRIRDLRQSQELTIAELSKMTGLTSSTISQVERAIISPSISTLKKIGNAMNIPLSYLFEAENQEDEEAVIPENEIPIAPVSMESFMAALPAANRYAVSPVVHKSDRKLLSPEKGVRFYLLNPDLSGPIEFIYNEYDPGSGTGSTLYSHPGVECGLILSGELMVKINDEEHVLKEGDSITFNSTDPHKKYNKGNTMCTCVWANVPPWF